MGRGQVAGCAGAGIGRRGGPPFRPWGVGMGLRVYAMPPFLGGTPAVGPDGRSLPAVRGGQRGAGCDRRSASCRARQPSASTLPMTRSMASCSSKKKEAPASSLGRGVRRLHEPRPEQGNVRAHIRDGKPEWRQGHSVPKKGLGTPSYG